MNMNMNLKFDFDDINLVPRYSIVDSRSECDTSIKFGKYTFKNPVMPANMESVINEELAIKLSQEGYFYVMHRFNFDSKSFIKKMKELNLVSSISIGVNEDSYNLLTELKNENIIPDYVTIDIAHGHSKKMKRMIKFIKENFGDDIFIIAGNVSSIEATVDLDKWGTDAIKVGVGPGCFTPDAKVLTNKGLVSIKDINIGDFVLTHNHRYRRVLQTHKYDNKDILLKINDLPMCTLNHEFYVIDKKDKEVVNNINIENYAKWVESSSLDKESHLLVKYNTTIDDIKVDNIDLQLIQIERIEEYDYNGDVIDLTVEDDESYNIEGIVVHNSACTTWPTTGFGSRNIQASIVNQCASVTKKHIICDGGIRNPGDISKSIVLGSSMVMIGGMLSAFLDSPGRIVEIDDVKYKEFYGSASSRQSNKTSRIEGMVKLNKMKNSTLVEYMEYLSECLQSSISYGGGNKLTDLYSVKWI